jgi:iron complex transport system substrate-binding protein
MELDDITGTIVDAAYHLHRDRGPGLLESFYEAVLACELRRRGLRVDRQKLIRFSYNGIEVGDAFRADLIVEESVIVEVKSVERTAPVHPKQLLTYLRLTNMRVGLLLNFGAEVMKEGIRRVVNEYEPPASSPLRVNAPEKGRSPSGSSPRLRVPPRLRVKPPAHRRLHVKLRRNDA